MRLSSQSLQAFRCSDPGEKQLQRPRGFMKTCKVEACSRTALRFLPSPQNILERQKLCLAGVLPSSCPVLQFVTSGGCQALTAIRVCPRKPAAAQAIIFPLLQNCAAEPVSKRIKYLQSGINPHSDITECVNRKKINSVCATG